MDLDGYKLHVYTAVPELSANNELDRSTVIDALVKLTKRQDVEDNYNEEEEEIRENFETRLRPDFRDNTAFVLVEDKKTHEFVGYGSLVKTIRFLDRGNNVGMLGRAYVLPEYRRQGIYAELIRQREELARQMHYDVLVVAPAEDGRSQRVLERFGYQPISQPDEEIILMKVLQNNSEEGQSLNSEIQNPRYKL